jgi:NAD(P)-dependent dehydrogenase (short-subunit alcohol dehydrogenase family)
VALVTGAASGIGAACAVGLAESGHDVAVVDLDGDGAETVAGSLGGDARSWTMDVSDEASVASAVAGVAQRFGRLDTVVNAAGTSGRSSSVVDLPAADWDRTIAVNLRGSFLVSRATLGLLEADGGGSLTFISSGAGRRGFATLADYVASKHGVIGLMRSLALEYARRGVRINAVCPGTILTQMLVAFAGGSPEAAEKMGRMAPIGRIGTPDEVAAAVTWLSSAAASFITGAVIDADGGVSAA